MGWKENCLFCGAMISIAVNTLALQLCENCEMNRHPDEPTEIEVTNPLGSYRPGAVGTTSLPSGYPFNPLSGSTTPTV